MNLDLRQSLFKTNKEGVINPEIFKYGENQFVLDTYGSDALIELKSEHLKLTVRKRGDSNKKNEKYYIAESYVRFTHTNTR